MDVFGVAAGASGEFLRAAALDAAHELDVFMALAEPRTLDELADAIGIGAGRRRLRALLDVLAALGVLARRDDRYVTAAVPARSTVPRAGWGLLADVIRRDQPLPFERGEAERRMHQHLAEAGAAAARELASSALREVRERTKHNDAQTGAVQSNAAAEHPARSPVSQQPVETSPKDSAHLVALAFPFHNNDASLLDLGGGAGAYTAAFLDAYADARATVVDTDDVIALAREHLARFGSRVDFVASDIRAANLGSEHSVALLANVLHLHGPSTCAELCAIAARAVAPGGIVVIKDLRVDDGRAGPIEGLLFALNMAVYTDAGDVYETSQLRSWLATAGLINIDERRLESAPDAVVVIGRRPVQLGVVAKRESEPSQRPGLVDSGRMASLRNGKANTDAIEDIGTQLDSALSRMGKVAWRELQAAGTLREGALPIRLEFPSGLRRRLASAIAIDREASSLEGAQRTEQLERHYVETMPRMRVAQIASSDEPGATFMHTPLDWTRLPRMSSALDRLFDQLGACGVDATVPLGAPSATAFRASTPTLTALYTRTHYGGCMPLLYGYPADLAYFKARGSELGLDIHATIDRYFTAPIIHELCHFARDREPLPMHLDECVGGWLGVHVWPQFAYPEADHDDAIFAAPWLSQVGQAIARAFGIAPIVRAQSGAVPWAHAVPASFVAAATRVYDDDWRARRTLHFLSDTLEPRPWVALALLVAAGHDVHNETLESLAAKPLASLAVPDDAELDRAIVCDALRAMCLDNARIDGSFRARTRLPDAPIQIDAPMSRVTTMRRGVDSVDPAYWLPPAVAARMLASGISGYELRLGAMTAIPDAAEAICSGSPGHEPAGFALLAARTP